MSRDFLAVAALVAWIATQPCVRAQGRVDRYSGDPARAHVLATKYNTEAERVLGLRRQFKMEWGDIEQALIIASAVTNDSEKSISMDTALNRVLELRAMGQEWNDIAQHYSATLPEQAKTKVKAKDPVVESRASRIKESARVKVSVEAGSQKKSLQR